MWRGLIRATMHASDRSERATHFRFGCPRSRHERAARGQAATCRELTLDDILSDPIVVALMRADGVDAGEFATMVNRVNRHRGVIGHGEGLVHVE